MRCYFRGARLPSALLGVVRGREAGTAPSMIMGKLVGRCWSHSRCRGTDETAPCQWVHTREERDRAHMVAR